VSPLLVAADHGGTARVIAGLFQKQRDARRPVGAQIYARGGHGFNMSNRMGLASLEGRPHSLGDWMADNEILTTPEK
jgi:hypothetical protein